MRRDDPVLADDALERDQLTLVVLVRCVGGDVDVAPVILEDGAVIRISEARLRFAVEPERLRDTVRLLLRAAVEVDPEQLPAAQPLWALEDRRGARPGRGRRGSLRSSRRQFPHRVVQNP